MEATQGQGVFQMAVGDMGICSRESRRMGGCVAGRLSCWGDGLVVG
jgi:hypothetical protein